MSLPKTYRPAWREMGWWRWLSILLVTFSLVLIIPYSMLAGGSHELTGEVKSGTLAGCAYDMGLAARDGQVRVTVKFDARCALEIEAPTLQLLDAEGIVLAQEGFDGNPNALTVRLRFDPATDAVPAAIVLASQTIGGAIDQDTWPMSANGAAPTEG